MVPLAHSPLSRSVSWGTDICPQSSLGSLVYCLLFGSTGRNLMTGERIVGHFFIASSRLKTWIGPGLSVGSQFIATCKSWCAHIWVSAASYWGSKGIQHCFFVFFFSPKKTLLGGDKYHSESIHSTDIGKYYKWEPCFPKELATNIYKYTFLHGSGFCRHPVTVLSLLFLMTRNANAFPVLRLRNLNTSNQST